MRDIAAVVITYNRRELLRKNIQCLLNQKGAECDIYIIDNASTDQTREMVKSFTDSRIHYFNTGSNLGGAGGFEYGTRQAVEDGYRLVWIIDDDGWPEDTALHELLEADKQLGGQWGALSSAAFWYGDGSVCKSNRPKKSLFRFVTDRELRGEALIRVEFASFLSLLVKAEAVRKVGLPIGQYVVYTDDWEFTGRIARQYEIYVVPKSIVIHAMKENKKVNFAVETPDRLWRFQHMYRNDVHCYRQYGLKGWIYLVAKFAYTIANILINSKTERLSKIRTVIRGYKEGFSFRPVIRRVSSLTYWGGGALQKGSYYCFFSPCILVCPHPL